MNTLLTQARSGEQNRLEDYARLTRDIRIPHIDRLTLRLGLWLLLAGARRADRNRSRQAYELRVLARQTHAQSQREAYWCRAAVSSQYR